MAAKTEIPDLHAALDGTARYLRLADCLRASIPGIDLEQSRAAPLTSERRILER